MVGHIWICPLCFDEEKGPLEFKTKEEQEKHMKKFHSKPVVDKSKKIVEKTKKKPPIEVKQKAPIVPEKQTQPLRLTYKYIGQCPNCHAELETIPLDIDKRKKDLIVVGWCQNCHEKRIQREVAKL